MIEIDGSRYSGSGTIVRLAVAYAALTGRAVRVVNARVRRSKPGLRRQHARVIEAICELTGGSTEGVREGSQEFSFHPGRPRTGPRHCWDIGSAGSTTLLALALLPVLARIEDPAEVELRGGLFQDFAPSFFHLQQVILPLLARMGLEAEVTMLRPGYTPVGGGILRLKVVPVRGPLRPLVLEGPPGVADISGIALASHLKQRDVARRMAQAARQALGAAGPAARIELQEDTTALQPGAAFALIARVNDGWTLGADGAGAPRRPAEAIGKRVAQQLLSDLGTGAAVDRYAADQIIPFAALAEGESRFLIPAPTDHVASNAWLAGVFLGAEVRLEERFLVVRGAGFPN